MVAQDPTWFSDTRSVIPELELVRVENPYFLHVASDWSVFAAPRKDKIAKFNSTNVAPVVRSKKEEHDYDIAAGGQDAVGLCPCTLECETKTGVETISRLLIISDGMSLGTKQTEEVGLTVNANTARQLVQAVINTAEIPTINQSQGKRITTRAVLIRLFNLATKSVKEVFEKLGETTLNITAISKSTDGNKYLTVASNGDSPTYCIGFRNGQLRVEKVTIEDTVASNLAAAQDPAYYNLPGDERQKMINTIVAKLPGSVALVRSADNTFDFSRIVRINLTGSFDKDSEVLVLTGSDALDKLPPGVLAQLDPKSMTFQNLSIKLAQELMASDADDSSFAMQVVNLRMEVSKDK